MKKDYKAIAGVEAKSRTKGLVLVVVLMVLCVIALLLSIYSFSTENIVFGVSYIIGILLGLSYIVIKLNQMYTTYIAADDENIILKCWDNHFFAYNAWSGIPVLREFIPSRSQEITIPMSEISTILIGTKSFIKRNAEDPAFDRAVLPYENQKYSNVTGLLNKANILYIKTFSGESVFMSIEDFNAKDTMNVLNRFARFCSDDIDIRINLRSFRRYLARPELASAHKDSESENIEATVDKELSEEIFIPKDESISEEPIVSEDELTPEDEERFRQKFFGIEDNTDSNEKE